MKKKERKMKQKSSSILWLFTLRASYNDLGQQKHTKKEMNEKKKKTKFILIVPSQATKYQGQVNI